jgi:isochorismate hydrolase
VFLYLTHICGPDAANERGYERTIVTDEVTDPDEGAHHNSFKAIFPRIAELATTEEVLTALAWTG